MWDITGLLPITPMERKAKERRGIYRAHGILRPFMTELVVSPSSSQQWEGRKEEKTDETKKNKARKKEKGQVKIGCT